MGKVYAELDERLTNFISRQPVFFVATAPCLTSDGEGGHVNVSPKGYRDTFAVLGPRTGFGQAWAMFTALIVPPSGQCCHPSAQYRRFLGSWPAVVPQTGRVTGAVTSVRLTGAGHQADGHDLLVSRSGDA
jgi:hypothetical protein